MLQHYIQGDSREYTSLGERDCITQSKGMVKRQAVATKCGHGRGFRALQDICGFASLLEQASCHITGPGLTSCQNGRGFVPVVRDCGSVA